MGESESGFSGEERRTINKSLEQTKTNRWNRREKIKEESEEWRTKKRGGGGGENIESIYMS